MKLTTKQDLEAPIGFVWRSLTDFDSWERTAMRRGAEVVRTDNLTSPGPGMSWAAKYTAKGQVRDLKLRLLELDPTSRAAIGVTSKMFDGKGVVELIELSARRTRVHVSIEASPLTLTARLLLQSIKLGKARVQRKFEGRLSQLTADIEQRYLSQPRG